MISKMSRMMHHGRRTCAMWVALLLGLPLIPFGGSVTLGQAVPESRQATATESVIELDNAAPEPPLNQISVDSQGRVELHVRDLDLAAVLHMLSMHSRRNIVATEGVQGRKVTANLYDVTFEEALDVLLISHNCTWHKAEGFVYVYPSVPSKESEARPLDIQVSLDGRVTLRAYEQPLSTVLQALASQANRNIIPDPDASERRVNANLKEVPFDQALTAILGQHGGGWEEQDNLIYVYSPEAWARKSIEKKEATLLETRLFRLHYITAEEAEKMITPLLSTIEGEVSALNRSSELRGNIAQEQQFEGSSGWRGQSSAGQQDGVASSVTRSRQLQPVGRGSSSSTEKELVETIQSESAAFSIGSKDMDNAWLLVRDYKDNLNKIAEVIAQIDARPRQVLVEATILRARLDENNALGIDFNFVGGVDFQALGSTSTGITNLVTGDLPLNRMNDTNITTRTDFNDAIAPGGFTFGLVKGSVSVFVRALEEITDTTILANPKMLVLDKQEGQVLVGREDGYRNTIVTQTAAIETVEQLQTGTKFRFRPFIGDDGFVRVQVRPEDSSGGLTGANLPFKQTTEVETSVVVRDGHTILIGGLFREASSAARGQVPVVGNIPVAGALFRNSRDSTQREEVIILLTVHVVKNEVEADKASMAAMQDVERYRVGMRQGLQLHGRERLAQAHYRWAQEHLAKGHRGQALWDLELALNNNPALVPAMRLKERITSRRDYDEDGSSVRGFVRRQIMRETGELAPLFGRPEPLLDDLPLQGPSGFDDGDGSPPQATGSIAPFTTPSQESTTPVKEDT